MNKIAAVLLAFLGLIVVLLGHGLEDDALGIVVCFIGGSLVGLGVTGTVLW